jgi:hypothetical protein
VWILDSISGLEQMSAQTAATPLTIFPVRPGVMWKMASKRDFDAHDVFQGQNPPAGAILDFWLKSKPDLKDVKITISRNNQLVATLKPSDLDAGMNRIVWNLRADRPVPLTAQEQANAERNATQGGGQQNLGGPLVDPGGDYVVEISIGNLKDNKRLSVEEDPRITWFSSADRAKRRAAIDDLVDLTKQADALRKKFTGADAALTSLQASWKRPDAPKIPDDVKKMAESLKTSFDDLRPMFANRGFGPEQQAPLEERKAELAHPEPDFVLQPLANRVSQLINQLDSFAAAPSQTQLQQVALVKTAIAGAGRSLDQLRTQVVRFNDALNTAKVPFVPVP